MLEKERNLKDGELLSIGTVSRLSGVNIKSLRYYDRLGILKPAYIDPDSSYRYYTFPQLTVIDAIKICTELDIPLKIFSDFLDEDGRRIHYEKLLEYGRGIAEKKIKAIEEGLAFINETQEEIDRASRHRGKMEPITCEMPEKVCFMKEWQEGHQEGKGKYYTKFTQLMLEAEKEGFSIGYEIGQLHFYKKGQCRRCIFVDVQRDKLQESPHLHRIPKGTYLCRPAKRGSIEQVKEQLPLIDWAGYSGVVIETELFTGEFDFERPVYELRCLTNGLKK